MSVHLGANLQVLFEPENILYTIAGLMILALVLGTLAGFYFSRRSHRRTVREETDLNRAIFEQVAEGVFLYDSETKVIKEANPSLCASLGFESQEIRDRTVYDIFSGDRETVDEDTVRIVEKGRHTLGERVYRGKDGSLKGFEVTASRVSSAGRNTICVVARDMSESREAQTHLREAEERYRTLVEQVPAIIYIEDFETGATLYDSPQVESILGYPADTCQSDPYYWKKIIHSDDRERVTSLGKSNAEAGHSLTEYRVKSRSDKIVWLQDEAWLIRDDEGEPRFWRGIIFDITPRKATESSLRESEQLYRSLIRLAPGAVFVQQDGRIVSVNDPGDDVLGPREEITGKPMLGFIHPDDRRMVRNMMRLVDRGESPDQIELKMNRTDGETIDTEFAASPVTYGGKPAAQIVIRNVTEIRAIEREADLQRAEMVRSNAELERFAYMVTHDLKIPLKELGDLSAVLLGREHDTSLSDEDREYLFRIGDLSRRLDRMLSELLDLSRITRRPMETQDVDLSEIARSVTSKLRQQDSERRVEVIVAGGLSSEGDRELLETAIHNLMENAWKFTSESPRPRIVFGMVEREREPVYFVRDNGIGFDMAHAGKLFAPFQTLHSEGDAVGAGVGLSAVARVIERHGGRIWSESEVGKGATFYFTL